MKRFYSEVTVAESGGGWRVLLDARPIKSAGGHPQVAPTRALADALAEEWAAQGAEIDPAAFPLRDLADYAIDIAAPDRTPVIAELLAFAETDTLCYRADPDEPLYRRQRETWEPLLYAAEAHWGVRFERVSGVIHRPQPAETLARLREVLSGFDGWTLAGLRSLAGLAVSLVIALAALAAEDVEALWNAAELEEAWQAELWGADAEVEARRALRFAAFAAAARFTRLAAEPSD